MIKNIYKRLKEMVFFLDSWNSGKFCTEFDKSNVFFAYFY